LTINIQSDGCGSSKRDGISHGNELAEKALQLQQRSDENL
jgi:hypothetical protein